MDSFTHLTLKGKLNNSAALEWSRSNQLLIQTQSYLHIASPELSLKASIQITDLIPKSHSEEDASMQLIWKREIVSCEDGKETTFNPTAYKTEYFSRALWSPCGISIHGGCLLLVLTNYGRVVLLSAKDDPNLGPFEPLFTWSDFAQVASSAVNLAGAEPSCIKWSKAIEYHGALVPFIAIGFKDGRMGIWSLNRGDQALLHLSFLKILQISEDNQPVTHISWKADRSADGITNDLELIAIDMNGKLIRLTSTIDESLNPTWEVANTTSTEIGFTYNLICPEDMSHFFISKPGHIDVYDSTTLNLIQRLDAMHPTAIITSMNYAEKMLVAVALDGGIACWRCDHDGMYQLDQPFCDILSDRSKEVFLGEVDGGEDDDEDEDAHDELDQRESNVFVLGCELSPLGFSFVLTYTKQTPAQMSICSWTDSQHRFHLSRLPFDVSSGKVEQMLSRVMSSLSSAAHEKYSSQCMAYLLDDIFGLEDPNKAPLLLTQWCMEKYTESMCVVFLQAIYYILMKVKTSDKNVLRLLDRLIHRQYLIEQANINGGLSTLLINWIILEYPFDRTLLESAYRSADLQTKEWIQNLLADSFYTEESTLVDILNLSLRNLVSHQAAKSHASELKVSPVAQSTAQFIQPTESCPICQEAVFLEHRLAARCKNGHSWDRCRKTMQVLDNPLETLKCSNCQAKCHSRSAPYELCILCLSLLC